MRKLIQKYTHNFILCGTIGWCMEIIFTAAHSFIKKDYTLKGVTSIWMFPIYGCAAFLLPICQAIRDKAYWLRGMIYTVLIFVAEYTSGSILRKYSLCPWDYQGTPFQINRLIRLDYAPFWFAAGLLFERILTPKKIS